MTNIIGLDHDKLTVELLKKSGVVGHEFAHSLDTARLYFPELFEGIQIHELVIASGQTTFIVDSMADIEKRWGELHKDLSGIVHIYIMPRTLWYALQASFRKQ